MGGSPVSDDILLRMKASAYKEPQTMSIVVVLCDRKTGECYEFRYDERGLECGDNTNTMIAKTFKRLAEEWKGYV